MTLSAPPSHSLASGLGLSHGEVRIPPEQATAVRAASNHLHDVLYAEQKFDILVENYIELENALLRSTLHQVVYDTYRSHHFEVQRDLFNRLFSNLLSAARAYLDFMPQAAGRLFVDGTESVTRCQSARAAAYEKYLGYRVMEGLRNFTQHEGLPVQALRFTADSDGDQTRMVISFYAQMEEMRESKVFKKPVQAELDGLGSEVLDLKRMMREYLSGVSEVHELLRSEMQTRLTGWEATLSTAAASFKLIAPDVHEDTIGVIDRTKEPAQFMHLPFLAWRHMQHLRQKNGFVRDLHRHFVSGQLVPEPPGQLPKR